MAISLRPTMVFRQYSSLRASLLREHGVTLLLSDLDYTLAPRSRRFPDEGVRAWLAELERNGITVVVISNNRNGERAKDFCAPLGIDFVRFAGKPSTKGLQEALERTGKKKEETAMLGDKLLTDVLAANRFGIPALMVEPLEGPAGAWNHVLHFLQRPFKAAAKGRF